MVKTSRERQYALDLVTLFVPQSPEDKKANEDLTTEQLLRKAQVSLDQVRTDDGQTLADIANNTAGAIVRTASGGRRCVKASNMFDGQRIPLTQPTRDEQGNISKKQRLTGSLSAVIFRLRRNCMGSQQIQDELRARYPTMPTPSRDSINRLFQRWYAEGDPMEWRIRLEQARIKYTPYTQSVYAGIPRSVLDFFFWRDLYKEEQSEEGKAVWLPSMRSAWRVIKHIPKEVLIKYYKQYKKARG